MALFKPTQLHSECECSINAAVIKSVVVVPLSIAVAVVILQELSRLVGVLIPILAKISFPHLAKLCACLCH